MLRAALLYGDRVTFIGVRAQLVLSTVFALTNPASRSPELLRTMLSALPNNRRAIEDGWDRYMALRRKRFRRTDELLFVRRFEAVMDKCWEELAVVASRIAMEPGTGAVIDALGTGIVTLAALPSPDELTGSLDGWMDQYMTHVDSALGSATTYPLFDEQTAQIAKARVEEGLVHPHRGSVVHGKQAGLADFLFERIPAFDNLDVATILELRADLGSALAGFRAAIIGYTNQFEFAAWDSEFPVEAEQLMRSIIEPTLLELQDAIRSNRLWRHVLREATGQPALLPSSALGVLVGRASELNNAVALALTVGAAVAIGTTRAIASHGTVRRENTGNRLFFYYATQKAALRS